MRWIFVLVSLQSFATFGQSHKRGDDLLWTRYLNAWNLTPRYLWINELDTRVTTTWDHRAQTIFHSHLHRLLSPQQELAVGFTASQVRRKEDTGVLTIPEVRIFEEWIYRIPLEKRHSLQSKIRLEQRFFPPSEALERGIVPGFQVRFRYQAMYRVQLPHQWAWRLSNEWMAQTPWPFSFDQNRLATSLEIPLHPSLSVEGGYIWLLTQGRVHRSSTDVFRLTLHHRIQPKGGQKN